MRTYLANYLIIYFSNVSKLPETHFHVTYEKIFVILTYLHRIFV
jgi:hypothetical protein